MNLKRSLVLLVIIICMTVNAAGIILYERYRDVQASEQWVAHTNEVIIEIQGFYGNIEKLVAMQRGYLLSREPQFLTGYDDTIKLLNQRFGNVKSLTLDSRRQQARLKELEDQIEDLKRLLRRNLDTGNDAGDIRDNTLAVKRAADAIREQTRSMASDERLHLGHRVAQQKKQEKYYTSTLLIASLASIGVLLIANVLILSMAGKQKAAENELGVANKNLYETRERMELALRGTSDGIFDWNLKDNGVYYSPRFRDMLGYSEDELPHTVGAFVELIHPEDRAKVDAQAQHYLNHDAPDYRVEFRVRHKDGGWRWHLARGVALFDGKGQAYRMVGAHTDITEDKMVEERLRASNKELENFTYIASHDLRSPLVNLKGFAGEIEQVMSDVTDFVNGTVPKTEQPRNIRAALETDLPQALDFIKASVTKMEKLTKAILELSRVGRRQLKIEALDVRAIVDTCVKSLQHQIAQKNVTVAVGDLYDCMGDAVAIEQVFGNIIDNAIKYLDPARPGRVDISAEHHIYEIVYKVTDNGRGIRAEDYDKVFELFKRAGRSDDIPGEGMGMSYVQAILRRHNGAIWLDSKLGQGTTFYFSLPSLLTKEKTRV